MLSAVPGIGARESDALASHLRHCRPDMAARGDEQLWTELGPLLEQFDVQRDA